MSERPQRLLLFDIDGTLLRRAGPHHRRALERGVEKLVAASCSLDGVPTQGALDFDLLEWLLAHAGLDAAARERLLPELTARCEAEYLADQPATLEANVCPGVYELLERLQERRVVLGVVSGNLPAIGWRKLELAGLRSYFSFGEFSNRRAKRADLVRQAIETANWPRYAAPSPWLVGDHPNDIQAALANGVQALGTATGLSTATELRLAGAHLVVDNLALLDLEAIL